MSDVSIVKIGGVEMAILPKVDLDRINEDYEMSCDVAAAEAADKARGDGEEAFPLDFILLLSDPKLNNLKLWRDYRGMTQKELCTKAGLADTHVSKIERGHKMNGDTARKLAAALDCEVGYFNVA